MGSQQENNNLGRISEQESSCIREDNLSTLETELLHPFSQKIDQFSAKEIVELMNQVDADVIRAVADQVDEIAAAIEVIFSSPLIKVLYFIFKSFGAKRPSM